MKLHDIKHILDTDPGTPNPTLRFTSLVDDMGIAKSNRALNTPDDWDHVRHLTGKLFYAWNNDDPKDGCVYVGEFR